MNIILKAWLIFPVGPHYNGDMDTNYLLNNLVNPCIFYVVRHGQTEHNLNRITQGHTDSPLTELGITQAKNLQEEFKDIKFDCVFSSDLLRTKRTAEIIAAERQLMVETTHLLRERNFGHFDGKPNHFMEEVYQKYIQLQGDERKMFKLNESAESDEEVASRLLTFLRETAIVYPERNILVVSSGSALRILLEHLGEISTNENLRVENGGYIKIASDGDEFVVLEKKGLLKRSSIL